MLIKKETNPLVANMASRNIKCPQQRNKSKFKGREQRVKTVLKLRLQLLLCL